MFVISSAFELFRILGRIACSSRTHLGRVKHALQMGGDACHVLVIVPGQPDPLSQLLGPASLVAKIGFETVYNLTRLPTGL